MEAKILNKCIQCKVNEAQKNDVVCKDCRDADCAANFEMHGNCDCAIHSQSNEVNLERPPN